MIKIGKRSLNLTRVLAILVYWLLIFPIGLFQKIFDISNFDPGLDESAKSYWMPRKEVKKPIDRYRRQF